MNLAKALKKKRDAEDRLRKRSPDPVYIETASGSSFLPTSSIATKQEIPKIHYTHTQTLASDSWSISHDLGNFPSVTVVDSAGSVVLGQVVYIDEENITITFSAEFSGKAYLN